MTHEQAKEKAMSWVFISLSLGDVEDEYSKLGKKPIKSRQKMEQTIIDHYAREWSK